MPPLKRSSRLLRPNKTQRSEKRQLAREFFPGKTWSLVLTHAGARSSSGLAVGAHLRLLKKEIARLISKISAVRAVPRARLEIQAEIQA